MEMYQKINSKIGEGYQLLLNHQTSKACDAWLDAWEDIKAVMAEDKISDLPALQQKYQWTQLVMNYAQDLEEALHNAAIDNPQYYAKRIKYCEELLALGGYGDELIIENTRRAIAESHFALGNKQECDRLFGLWLADDPTWGWGYIGWSDCYQYGTQSVAADPARAEEIINTALKVKGLRDRADVVERAIDIYTALGKEQPAAELGEELETLSAAVRSRLAANRPLTVTKVGRNEPCPCGSGKKYKKCCGR